LSGKAYLLELGVCALLAAVWLLSSCGGEGSEPAGPAHSESPTARADAPVSGSAGRPITPADSAYFLPLLDDGRQAMPVAAYGEQFLLSETPAPGSEPEARQRFTLWDPVAETRTLAWESEPGKQDIVTGLDGDLAIAVRTGLELPFAEWTLLAVDLASGEIRVLAESDPAVTSAPGISPRPPFGFAPYPAVHGGRLAWAEYRMVDGVPKRQVVLFDLATGASLVVASVDPAAGEDLASPSLGGERAAWVRSAAGNGSEVILHHIPTGDTTTLPLDAEPFAVALDGSGEYVAWDDLRGGKHTALVDGGEQRQFAADEGWGIIAAGSRFSWAPAAAYGGTGGFYDLETGELRLVERESGVQVNFATVLNSEWFAWQRLEIGPDGRLDPEQSGYYFLALPG
jgi:hypothetical protein